MFRGNRGKNFNIDERGTKKNNRHTCRDYELIGKFVGGRPIREAGRNNECQNS